MAHRLSDNERYSERYSASYSNRYSECITDGRRETGELTTYVPATRYVAKTCGQ